LTQGEVVLDFYCEPNRKEIRMTLKTIIAAAALAVVPALASAQCAGSAAKMDQQAMSCLPGTAWDAQTGICVPVATS